MRVLLILGGFRVGGYEVLSVNIANALVQKQDDVAVLTLSEDNEIVKRVNPAVKIQYISRYFKYDVSIIIRVAHFLNSFNAEVVLSCDFFTYLITRIASLFSLSRSKFVLAFHVTAPHNEIEHKWNRIFARATRLFRDNYVAIHASQVDFYNSHYGLEKSRFSVIHNGVDTDYFSPLAASNVSDCFRISNVASIKPLKDQMTLLRAVVEFNKYRKEWRLKIAGVDHGNLLPRYEKFVADNSLLDKIEFLGSVHNVRELLWNSDVFVLTSLTEALPLSVIEAIATGLPCIVTHVGGNSDIIEHGKEGFLVKPGDYRAIARHLVSLADNLSLRRRMSIAARKKAATTFQFSDMVEKYRTLFSEVSGL